MRVCISELECSDVVGGQNGTAVAEMGALDGCWPSIGQSAQFQVEINFILDFYNCLAIAGAFSTFGRIACWPSAA